LTPIAKFASCITSKRIRAHGLILALCLWSVYLWNIGTPGLRDRGGNIKGTDFLHFYTLGSLALAHDGADLYSIAAQSALAGQRMPDAAGMQYLPLYPPQVSILFAPLARLDYSLALFVWLAASALIYGSCCYAIWRACPRLRDHRFTVLILAIGFPPFWHLIAWGQTSALALACFTGAFFALRSDKEFLAGLAFGCLIFKPQLGLAAAIIFLFTFRWKILAGALVASAVQLAGAVLYYGTGPIRDWISVLLHVPHLLPLFEPRIYQTHCLRTFWDMLVPWRPVALALYAISAISVCVLAIACWRRAISLSARYSALLLTSVLIAPHLTVYDLVILAPAFLLLSDWLLMHRENPGISVLEILLYLAFVLPLLGPLARWTHIQLSVPVMVAVLTMIWKSRPNAILVMESESPNAS
jgi:hypothetical protein